MRARLCLGLVVLTSLASSTGCEGSLGGGDDGGTARMDGGARDAASVDAPAHTLRARFFDLETDAVDPRFPSVPTSIPRPELVPRFTFLADVGMAEVGGDARSVRFTIDGGASVLDDAAPFVAGDAPFDPTIGAHTIVVTSYADAAGTDELASITVDLEITSAGMDPTPDEGAHAIHRLFHTETGLYLHRDGAGDFLDAAGTRVLAAADVTTEDRGEDGVHLVSASGPPIAFAFTLLLPDGFDPTVRYPLLVVLHHGGGEYRGTDNDPTLADQPPLDGPRSLSRSSLRHTFPAVILAPQLPFHSAIDGVNHEWAAFVSIDGTSGDFDSGPEPSVGAQRFRAVLDDLLAGRLEVEGEPVSVDPARLYLTGHSMGGLGSWDFVQREPDLWAGVVPMAGYSDHERAPDVIDTPLWAFHHRIDCYNTFAATDTMFRRVTEELGGTRMRFTALDFDTGGACDQAHFQTPGHAFQDETLLPWLFGQLNDRL